MTTASVDPEKILRDLRQLWSNLGREQETAGGVLRACAMTLLVAAQDHADAEQARRTMGVLMHAHPCRAVVLQATDGDTALDARVFAECWMPFGANQQICAEGIEITTGTQPWVDVARFLVPLIVPDLPVVLWCRGNRWFSPGPFDPLFSLAGKIVFDSCGSADPLAAIAALRALRGRTHAGIADLAWARLTGWRQVLANIFDDHITPGAAVSSVRIGHGGAPDPGVLYFKTWVERCLPAAVVSLAESGAKAGLHSVALAGSGVEIEIIREETSAVEIRVGAQRCRALLPSASDETAMQEELSIPSADPVFDKVLGG
jgi:glucose-6-phosphate dehydrogenase assembly protein OpcA